MTVDRGYTTKIEANTLGYHIGGRPYVSISNETLTMKDLLLSLGWVDKGDILVRYSSPRIGWKPEDGTLIIGYNEWPQKVTSIEMLEKIIDL